MRLRSRVPGASLRLPIERRKRLGAIAGRLAIAIWIYNGLRPNWVSRERTAGRRSADRSRHREASELNQDASAFRHAVFLAPVPA